MMALKFSMFGFFRRRVPVGRVKMAGNATLTTSKETSPVSARLVTLKKPVKQVSDKQVIIHSIVGPKDTIFDN